MIKKNVIANKSFSNRVILKTSLGG
jgi:hypothetical protein